LAFRPPALLLSVLLLTDILGAQQETVYMSVLSSRKHRIGASDNPVVGLFVSTDQGRTWASRGWREYIRTFYTEAGPDGTLWSACGNGVLRSVDEGRRWRVTTGWEVTEVLKVKIDSDASSIVYAATAYGIIKSGDGGETWKSATEGFHRKFTSDICIDRSNHLRLLAASEEGIYESRDGGGHWSLNSLRGMIVNTIEQQPRNPEEFLAGTEENGLFRSTDGGGTWRSAGPPVSRATVYAIAGGGSKTSTIFIGTFGDGVFRSVDGGETWERKSDGLKNLDIHSLVVLPSDPNIVLAGTLNGGLYRSTDGGETWAFTSQEDAQVWGLSVRMR
jgi:photosystem II stability/assembly factor-like uncharacterized protein